MSANYEHDQAQLLNAVAQVTTQAISTAVVVGTGLALKTKPVKVTVKTASEDVQNAHKAIKEGTPKEIVLKSILQGEVSQRVTERGYDSQKYAQLILHKAEIDQAVQTTPTIAPSQSKTPKKSWQ